MKLVLLLLAEALLALDWRQTLTIAAYPLKYSETNKYLGPHPTARAVSAYFAFWMAAIAMATLALPAAVAWILPAIVALIEAKETLMNRQHFGAWW